MSPEIKTIKTSRIKTGINHAESFSLSVDIEIERKTYHLEADEVIGYYEDVDGCGECNDQIYEFEWTETSGLDEREDWEQIEEVIKSILSDLKED